MSAKPIRVFYSELSGRFYASAHYSEKDGYVVVTGRKYDVTDDIGAAIDRHAIEFRRLSPSPDKEGEGGET